MVPTWSRLKSAASSRGTLLALAGTAAGLTLAAALPVAAAQAASCPETTLVQPFKAIEEKEKITPNYYSLVAGGAFEAGEAAWTLSGGAKVPSGGGISALTGKEVKASLDLPKGAVAVSPLTCVEPNDRTFRFLDRGEGSTGLTVSVVYVGLSGLLSSKIDALSPPTGKELAASPILHTGAHTAAKLSGGYAYMSIRFESTAGTARVDDVYLDPRMR
ncbi:MAG: hypothetical protein ACLQMH_09645 [Solirubrobacteraceae bacterium]